MIILVFIGKLTKAVRKIKVLGSVLLKLVYLHQNNIFLEMFHFQCTLNFKST